MTSTVRREFLKFRANLMAKAFGPGPLTMILKAKPGIYAPALSAGLPTGVISYAKSSSNIRVNHKAWNSSCRDRVRTFQRSQVQQK